MCAAIFATSCVGSKYSYKQKNEKVVMQLVEQTNAVALHLLKEQDAPLLAQRSSTRGFLFPLIGQAISLAAQGVAKLIEVEKAKYTAEWQQSMNELYFYDQISESNPFDPTGIQFKGFKLYRIADIKKKVQDTLFYAYFEIDTTNVYDMINGSVFYLRLKELDVQYAKAKVPTTRWYIPWSWGNKKKDDKLNLDLEINFTSSYVTKGGSYFYDSPVGKFMFSLRDFPLLPDDPAKQVAYNNVLDKRIGGYAMLIPRSYGHAVNKDYNLKDVYSQGKYAVSVKVKESGKQKFITKLVTDNSQKILDAGSDKLKGLSEQYLNKY